MDVFIHKEEPQGFSPKFESVGCFIESKKDILLLHRQDDRPEGNTWGLPSGKIELGETPLQAIAREIKEETSIVFPENELMFLRKVYVRYPEYDFVYHMFSVALKRKREVAINPEEHKGFIWMKPKDAFGLPLIRGMAECIKLIYDA